MYNMNYVITVKPYRAAAWIGYYQIFLHTYWQNCMKKMAHSMKIQNIETVASHKVFSLLAASLNGD